MLTYVLEDGSQRRLSYSELKEDYLRYKHMSDTEFEDNIPQILHFCCIVAFLKETPTYVVLADDGIIHRLVHRLSKIDDNIDLRGLRDLFNITMELV